MNKNEKLILKLILNKLDKIKVPDDPANIIIQLGDIYETIKVLIK